MHLFNDYLNAIELPLLKSLHGALECGFLDTVMPPISKLCDAGWFWIALAVILIIPKKTRRIGVTMGIALAIGLIVCNFGLKPLTARIRPYDADAAINLIIAKESEFSFPSGHSIASFEGAFAIFLYDKRWGAAALVLAALIAFSRLYLMVHYFTDVIVGALLGILFAYLAYRIYRAVSDKLSKKKVSAE